MKRYWLTGRDGDRTCGIQFFDSDLSDSGNWMPQTSMQGHPHIRTSQIDAFLKATTIVRSHWNGEAGVGVDARKEAAAVLEAAGWKTEMGEADDSLTPKEARANIRLDNDLWVWARQQPEGASELVRRLLQQERARQEAISN